MVEARKLLHFVDLCLTAEAAAWFDELTRSNQMANWPNPRLCRRRYRGDSYQYLQSLVTLQTFDRNPDLVQKMYILNL